MAVYSNSLNVNIIGEIKIDLTLCPDIIVIIDMKLNVFLCSILIGTTLRVLLFFYFLSFYPF